MGLRLQCYMYDWHVVTVLLHFVGYAVAEFDVQTNVKLGQGGLL